ncbi:MAG: metal ABC transporter substrate-binding protein [Acholeplasmataceae bacterium]
MKKLLLSILALGFLFTLIGCSEEENYDIVTTMYTHYSFAKQIAGDEMTVKMLVPVGEEIHGFEASSQDMVLIKNAKLFIYTSDLIDTWITDSNTIGGDQTIVLNMSKSIETITDAHYWVDPSNAIDMINDIKDAIIEIDPTHSTTYQANADQVINDITTKSNEMKSYFSNITSLPTTYVAGHNAFSLFGNYFGLTIVSIFNEFEPDSDLTSSELVTFVQNVLDAQTHYIFMEALEPPFSANAIQSELQTSHQYELTILKLYAYQNVTQDQFDQGLTYVDFMEINFQNIKTSLGA